MISGQVVVGSGGGRHQKAYSSNDAPHDFACDLKSGHVKGWDLLFIVERDTQLESLFCGYRKLTPVVNGPFDAKIDLYDIKIMTLDILKSI